MRITELPSGWRQRLTPASFGGAIFHVEVGGVASGRRIAVHEFPKRNVPYAEDMGRRARRWTVQGYIIVSPLHTDYIPTRDALRDQLEADGPAYLKLPTMEPELVMCDQFKMDETREKGGICVFDMVFVERGVAIVSDVSTSPREQLNAAGTEFGNAVQNWSDSFFNQGGGVGNAVQEAVEAYEATFRARQ